MRKIKEAQTNGYDYAVYTGRNLHVRPMGVLHMVPAMIEGFIQYRKITALYLRNKTKSTYIWNGCFPLGYNGKNKLQNFCDTLTMQKDDFWYAWVLGNM